MASARGGPAAGIRASGAGDKNRPPLVSDYFIVPMGVASAPWLSVINLSVINLEKRDTVFRGADCGCSARQRSVPPGLCPVPEVVVNRGAAPAGCGVVAWEQFDASVQVSQGVVSIRCRQRSALERTYRSRRGGGCHQDPASALLLPGRTAHPQGAASHPASSPGLAPAKPFQQWPGLIARPAPAFLTTRASPEPSDHPRAWLSCHRLGPAWLLLTSTLPISPSSATINPTNPDAAAVRSPAAAAGRS